MNTFVCESTFAASAARLDRQRLGKQRLEVWQMLRASLGLTSGWANHPAVRMWAGHELALAQFGLACHDEWIRRGYLDTTRARLQSVADGLPDTGVPWWVGDGQYMMHVRSVLVGKDPAHYGVFWPGTPVGLGSWWPDAEPSRPTVVVKHGSVLWAAGPAADGLGPLVAAELRTLWDGMVAGRRAADVEAAEEAMGVLLAAG